MVLMGLDFLATHCDRGRHELGKKTTPRAEIINECKGGVNVRTD